MADPGFLGRTKGGGANLLLPPANVVCEGYVFTPVCDSVNGGHAWLLLGGGVSGCSGGGGGAWLLGGGVCGCSWGGICVVAPGGACMVAPRGRVWLLGGCMVAPRGDAWLLLGGMHGCS